MPFKFIQHVVSTYPSGGVVARLPFDYNIPMLRHFRQWDNPGSARPLLVRAPLLGFALAAIGGLFFYLLLPRLHSRRARLLVGIATIMIALSIGFARLNMGAHYPTDVLAGYSFGLLWGGLAYTGIELFFARIRG